MEYTEKSQINIRKNINELLDKVFYIENRINDINNNLGKIKIEKTNLKDIKKNLIEQNKIYNDERNKIDILPERSNELLQLIIANGEKIKDIENDINILKINPSEKIDIRYIKKDIKELNKTRRSLYNKIAILSYARMNNEE